MWEPEGTCGPLLQSCATAAAVQCQREGLLFEFPGYSKAPSACQALHLQVCLCPQEHGFLLHTKELHRLPVLCAAGVLGRRKMEKEENKGRLGPQQEGGEAQAVGATSELLCDIPRLYHKELGPSSLSLSLFTSINLSSRFSLVLGRKWCGSLTVLFPQGQLRTSGRQSFRRPSSVYRFCMHWSF